MAATIYIRRLTGAGPTYTNIQSTTNRASTSDVAAPGSSDPIPIPAAGTKYSFWVSTQLYAFTAPTGTINNIKWYTDGASGFGTGTAMKAMDATTYDQASGTQGDTGDILNTTNYTTLTGATVDAFTFTSVSPKSITGSTTTTGNFGYLMVYQIEVVNGASVGTATAETITWKYDET
jgi:hypothetical protein